MDAAAKITLANYIGGAQRSARNSRVLEVYEPATGAVYAHCADSDAGDVDIAVDAAARAFPTWSALPADARARYLQRIADVIEARFEEFVEAESRDSGKTLAAARALDIPRAIANLRFFASAATQFASEAHASTDALNYTLRQPLGVVGCISPWNLPLYLFTWKIAPALAAGNTVVAKPSEVTPLTASMFAQACIEAELPEGVLNIVHGQGAGAGQALVEHARVKAVSFTGSTRTGAAIASALAPKFRKLSLEMGGKNATLVFADWDARAANLDTIVRSAFSNQGQICLCGSRILVERGHLRRVPACLHREGEDLAVVIGATRAIPPAILALSSRARISTRSWDTSRLRARKAAEYSPAAMRFASTGAAATAGSSRRP